MNAARALHLPLFLAYAGCAAMFRRVFSGVLGVSLVAGFLATSGCDRKTKPVPEAQESKAPSAVAATPVATASPAAKSAEANTFFEVAERLDQGGSLFFYLSTEAWLKGLSEQINSFRDLALAGPLTQQDPKDREKAERAFNAFKNLVKKSGLEEITGVGLSSFALEPEVYRNKFFVHHHKGQGTGFLWSAFGKEPHVLKPLQFLPLDTAFAASADFDLPALLNAVLQEIDQAEIPEAKMVRDQISLQITAATGMSLDEALQALGHSSGAILTLDPAKPIELTIEGKKESIPHPRLVLFMEVKDDRIFQQVEKAFSGNPAIVRVDEPGLKMRTMVLPLIPELPLRVTAAQWGNYLLLASDDQLIREMIAAETSGKGFASSPEFAKLSEGLPKDGNGFQLVTERMVQTWNRFQGDIFKMQAGKDPAQLALMEKIAAGQTAGAGFSVTAHVENGWLAVGKGRQGTKQIIAPLMVLPAAIALPAFGKAQEKGLAAKSLSNARQIFLGCKMYATANGGKFPPTLEALVPTHLPTPDVLKSPFKPEEPLGYEYTAGLTESSPADKILISDKFSGDKKLQVVVRVDGTGETKPAVSP